MAINMQKEGTAIVLYNEADEQVGEIHYEETGEDYVKADSTKVDNSLSGQGMGEQLLDRLVEEMEKENKYISAVCPYIQHKFKKHPEKYDPINYEKQKNQ